jgi:predicted dehydrogenase
VNSSLTSKRNFRDRRGISRLVDLERHSSLDYSLVEPLPLMAAPRKLRDEDALLRFRGGGKGVLTVSQIATGEANGLHVRIYASKGAILWQQENPNYLKLYRHGEPRQTLTRGRTEYLSSEAGAATRIPWGHPEGYLEAFANVYLGAIDAIRRHVDGAPIPAMAYDFPSVHDGCRGVQFIHRAVESANAGGTWVTL